MWWTMEFITTSKGGRKLIRNNFTYHLNKTLEDGNTYWECDKRLRGIGCKTKAVLNQQNKFLRQSGEHIHAPDPDKVLSASRSAIKRAAIETNASTNNIIAANIAGVTDNVLANLPRMETMRRDVIRQRATNAPYPSISDDDDTFFDIPQRFTVTSTEMSF